MTCGPDPDLGHEWVQIAPGARRCVRCRLRDADPSASYPCPAVHEFDPVTGMWMGWKVTA